MTEATPARGDKSFIPYEYTQVRVPRGKESIYRDTYRNFGWIFDGYAASRDDRHITLRIKRDRRIANRTLMQKLQQNCEVALRKIETLERARTALASAVAYAAGLVGCASLAGSVFSLNHNHDALSVVFGTIGIIWWIAPYFVYVSLRAKRTAEVEPLILEQYEVIYDTFARASGVSD